MELKEAEQKSLKESERLEKEIADVQELKVMQSCPLIFSYLHVFMSVSPPLSNSVYACHCAFLWFCFDEQKKLSTMTAEEYFEKHPELKKKFDDEIRNDYWGY